MNNNHPSPNAISHRELNNLLKKAQKEFASIDTTENFEIQDHQEFTDLIKNWTETSHKLLIMLSNKEHILSKNRKPKSLMAFGAMGAHINMALQALKASESDQ
tara:strand:+ start:536 stop:844 length:309 start_codon:yes stop_codon:yes gene_type:complete